MANTKSHDQRTGSVDSPFKADEPFASQADGPRTARDTVLSTAERQKAFGAEIVSSVAGAIRKGAGELDQNVPQAAGYIRYAADQVDSMSETLRNRDLGQLVSDLESFARRQPTAFMGATFVAGFMAIRFLKSSGARTGERRPMDEPASDWRAPSNDY